MAETDDIVASLRAWAPLVASGYTVPAAGQVMENAATALTDRDAQIERLTREKEEALNELHMKWCMACGTLTNDGDCDCTMYNGDASLQELRPYIEEYQKSMIECLSKAEARATTAERERDEARAEVERLLSSLTWFVDRRQPIQSKFDLHGPADTAKAMKRAFVDASAAIESARAALTKGGENGQS